MRAGTDSLKVAQIIPCSVGSYTSQIKALNDAIPAWAASLNTTQSPIWVVDQNTGMSSTDLRDGVHPNASGDQKMAAKWYPALINAFNTFEANATKVGGKMEIGFVS